MRCEQVRPYLPGFAGGDLLSDTRQTVGDHIAVCASCRAEVTRQSNVIASLARLSTSEVEPPAFLVDAVLEKVHEHRQHRLVPVLPIPAGEVARIISDHREAIASAAGTALVAAGAAYALWRAIRRPRGAGQPAPS